MLVAAVAAFASAKFAATAFDIASLNLAVLAVTVPVPAYNAIRTYVHMQPLLIYVIFAPVSYLRHINHLLFPTLYI